MQQDQNVRKILIINNYNYAAFVGECLHSALKQSQRFDQILFIDDGSTDNSVELVEKEFAGFAELQIVRKANAGQLSCFNAAVPYVSEDDLVFLMDADDVYPENYVESVLAEYQRGDDFLFSRKKTFAPALGEPALSNCRVSNEEAVLISSSSALTRFSGCWIGSPTSALIVSGRLFRQLFPFPWEADWITRADDVLVFGASLLGYRKKFLPSLAIAYRTHGNNAFHGKTFSRQEVVARQLRKEKLFGYFCDQCHIRRKARLFEVLDERALISADLHGLFRIPSKIRIVLEPLINLLRILKRLLK
jgi:glycosyltransferase involved in cell wall biosynthesis